MLRIESYVTPVILSYVNKYIKNIKPEDSQVSLWGGDAVFNNLDLRLDVLEEEFPFPFSFINGHIHELRIHVPWTKLMSEPVVITVNTIECVLRLKSIESSGSDSSKHSSSASGYSSYQKKLSKRQEFEVPTSYIQSLINRIINNVSIVCNNFILKYVEDDIVLSINAKMLELQSADGSWVPSFIDLSEELILRNILTLTDLTICLDKRCASGKIESYQEPFLYRCSLSCRIIRQFQTINSLYPFLTRYDVFCSHLQFSLSDTQLPMFLRLFHLSLALFYGYLSKDNIQTTDDKSTTPKDEEEKELREEVSPEDDSWSNWVWSVGSSVLPFYWEDESDRTISSKVGLVNHIFHFGIYVDIASWSFKFTELSKESASYGPSKMFFTPFLKMEQQGIFMSAVLKGAEASRVNMGISSCTIEPLGDCVCGSVDYIPKVILEDIEIQKSFSIVQYFVCGKESQEYLSQSLFDPQIFIGVSELWDYSYTLEKYFRESTSENLLQKTPSVAVDYLSIIDNSNELDIESFAESFSNLEYSNIFESTFCKLAFGSAEATVMSGFWHRVEAIMNVLARYDYQPYYSIPLGKVSPDAPVLCESEVSLLEERTPMRKFMVVMKNLSIGFYPAQHEKYLVSKDNFPTFKRRKKITGDIFSLTMPVPLYILSIEDISAEYTVPILSWKILSAIASLTSASSILNDICHVCYNLKCASAAIKVVYLEKTIYFIQKFAFSFIWKYTVLPTEALSSNFIIQDFLIKIGNFEVKSTAAQFFLFYTVVYTWLKSETRNHILFQTSLFDDAFEVSDSVKCFFKLQALEVKFNESKLAYNMKIVIDSINISLQLHNSAAPYYILVAPESMEDLSKNVFLKVILQCSKELYDGNKSFVLFLNSAKAMFVINPLFIDFLKYKPKANNTSVLRDRIKKVDLKLQSKKMSSGSETTKLTSLSSLSEDILESKTSVSIKEKLYYSSLTWKERIVQWYPYFSNLKIYLEIDVITFVVSCMNIDIHSEHNILQCLYENYSSKHRSSSLGDTVVIDFPCTVLKNANFNYLYDLDEYIYYSPVRPDYNPVSENFPWSLKMSNFKIHSLHFLDENQFVYLPFLKPVTATTTVALTAKNEDSSLSIAIVVHVDMTPIDIACSQCQISAFILIFQKFCDLYSHHLRNGTDWSQAQLSSNIFYYDSINASQVSVRCMSKQESESLPVSLFVKQHQLKQSASEFTASNTEPVTESKGKVLPEKSKSNVSLWTQWTVARSTLYLYAYGDGTKRRMTTELEDITVSVDIHEIYAKLKFNLASINVLHFQKKNNLWINGEYEGILMTCGDYMPKHLDIVSPASESSQTSQSHAKLNSELPKSHGFLSITATSALCQNVHKKWNEMVKRHFNEDRLPDTGFSTYLSEVDLQIQSFDVIFCPFAISIFIGVFEPLLNLQFLEPAIPPSNPLSSQSSVNVSLSSSKLPLLYVQMDGFRAFFPSKEFTSENFMIHDTVFIVTENIIVTPQVDNPISRLILNSDIYCMADDAHLLDIPGSEVENRQYQMDVNGLSISTGSWYASVSNKKGKPCSLSWDKVGLTGENPAVEWNNYDPTQEIKEIYSFLHPVISRFDVRIIGAPAITFSKKGTEEMLSEILVTGHSLEINVLSDIDIYLSMHQTTIIKSIIQDIGRFSYKSDRKQSYEVLDSGVDCDISSAEAIRNTANISFPLFAMETFVPFEFLLTAGKITANLFLHCYCQTSGKKVMAKSQFQKSHSLIISKTVLDVLSTDSEHSVSNSNFSTPSHKNFVGKQTFECEDGYDGSEEGSLSEGCKTAISFHDRIIPLLYVVLLQPHAFITCQPHKQKFDISVFDLILRGSHKDFSFKVIDSKMIPNANDYFTAWIETKPGNPDPKTGVPPSFMLITMSDFLHKPAGLCIDFGRPIKIWVSEKKWKEVIYAISTISSYFLKKKKNEDFTSAAKAEKSEFSMEFLKSLFAVLNFISLKVSEICPLFEISQNSVTSRIFINLCNVNTTAHINRKKEMLHTTAIVITFDADNLQAKTQYCNLKYHYVLKPLSFSSQFRISWQSFPETPHMEFKINFDSLFINLGPENVFCLLEFITYFNSLLEDEKVVTEVKSQSSSQTILYQDDLRAGIFQYVNSSDDPKPYQVIFNEKQGLMTWCYPEPRIIMHIDIYPVPFLASERSALNGDNFQEMACKLQYYDSIMEEFVTYKHFNLSESKFVRLDFPDWHYSTACSHLWRVCLNVQYSEDSSSVSHLKVSPLSLAACMRVDSTFSVDFLPKAQLYISFQHLEISFFNHLSLTGKKLPSSFSSYKLSDRHPETHFFLTTTFQNFNIRMHDWTSVKYVSLDSSLKADILNYKFFTVNKVFDPTYIKLGIYFYDSPGKDKPNTIEGEIVCNLINIYFSKPTFHTLHTSYLFWEQAITFYKTLDIKQALNIVKSKPFIIMTNYVFCNDFIETVRFGQYSTDEDIELKSKQVYLYGWRSQKVSSLIQFCTSSNYTWSEPFSIEDEGTKILKFGCGISLCHVLVIIQNLSNNVKKIIFRGQIAIVNYLHEHLEFRMAEKEKNKLSSKGVLVYSLQKHTVSESFSANVSSIRVRISNHSLWSGEIPLIHDKTETVVVHIPLKIKGDSITIFSKILKQKINCASIFLVVLSYPYMIRSNLPHPLTLHITTSRLPISQQFTVFGHGTSQPLLCDPSLIHQLTFQINSELEPSSPPVSLSKNLIDCMNQSRLKEDIDILKILDSLFVSCEEKWPFTNIKYTERTTSFVGQPKIDLQVDFTEINPYCNTVLINIQPWALIINDTNVDLLFKFQECSDTWHLGARSVFAPPKLDKGFYFGLTHNDRQFFSLSLQLCKEERWFLLKFEGRIPVNGESVIWIETESYICYLTLLTYYKKNIQIMHVLPLYNIANHTQQECFVSTYAVDSKIFKNNLQQLNTRICLPCQKSNGTYTSIMFWEKMNLSESLDSIKLLQFDVKGMFSCPLVIKEKQTDFRIPFSIHSDDTQDCIINKCFMLTISKNKRRIWIVLREDKIPQMLIHNNINVTLGYGQSSMKENGFIEEEIDFFSCIQCVPPGKSSYYTFPYTYDTFPNINTSDKYPKLHFALKNMYDNDNDGSQIWSQGVNIYQSYDQFINILGYGDVKVHLESVGQITHIFIDAASRIEVSARDVRSRIEEASLLTSNVKNVPIDQHKREHLVHNLDTAESFSDTGIEKNTSNVNVDTLHSFSFLCPRISLVVMDDSTKKYMTEILRSTFDNVFFSLKPKIDITEKLQALNYQVKKKMEISLYILDMQIDNQLFNGGKFDFPVIVVPQEIPRIISYSLKSISDCNTELIDTDSFIKILLEVEILSQGIVMNTLTVSAKPFSLYAEDTFFFLFFNYLQDVFPSSVNDTDGINGQEDLKKLPQQILVKSHNISKPIFIKHFIIHPLSLSLSVHAAVKLFIAVDQSPLYFSPYERKLLLTDSYTLGHNIAMHFLSGTLIRAGWVVSSLDMIGNPGGFARTVGTGVKDFVQMPLEGILEGPWAFISGITHGSFSLLRHITAGTVVSVTNLASSLARNMERLSLDNDHIARNEIYRRMQPKNAVYGILQGLSTFGISLLGAIGGLAQQPIEAVLENGINPSNLAGGIGKGLVGVVTKPIGGAADFLVHAGHGVLMGAGWKVEHSARCIPVKEYYSTGVNSYLKYYWKFLGDDFSRSEAILAVIDATLFSDTYIPVTVIVTSSVLLIVSSEEDSTKFSLNILDINYHSHSMDPSLLYIEKVEIPERSFSPDFEGGGCCPERVAEYVRSTCSEILERNEEYLDFQDEKEGSRNLGIKLYLSPSLRSALISALEFALKFSSNRGFEI